MPGILPPLSSCLPGSVVEERYAGSSMPTFPYLMPPVSPDKRLERHSAANTCIPVGYTAVGTLAKLR